MNKIIFKIAAALGVIAAFVGYGIVYGGDRKTIESMQKTDEKIQSDTEQMQDFIIEQKVYNERVTVNLENVTKVLDKLSQ